MMKVYRNKDGKVINIGEWDFMITHEEDQDGSLQEVINNPLPEYSTYKDEEIYILEDGGLSVLDNEGV